MSFSTLDTHGTIFHIKQISRRYRTARNKQTCRNEQSCRNKQTSRKALGSYLKSYKYNLRIVSQLLSAAAYDDGDNDNAATDAVDDELFI